MRTKANAESRKAARVRTGLIILALLAGLALATILTLPAKATDNTTDDHWHSESAQYKRNPNLPVSWPININKAADDWDSGTVFPLHAYTVAYSGYKML